MRTIFNFLEWDIEVVFIVIGFNYILHVRYRKRAHPFATELYMLHVRK